jgi:hypothetical protein
MIGRLTGRIAPKAEDDEANENSLFLMEKKTSKGGAQD